MSARPSVGAKVMSAGLWMAGAAWLLPCMATMMALQTVLRSDQIEWLNRLYCWGQVALTGSRWVPVVHDSVRPDRPYMFCQNHVNHFDHCTMYRATPHFKQGLELEAHFKYPVYGWFMRQRGTIPVKRGSARQLPEIMNHMRQEVARGHSLLAFPEGHRTRDGQLRRFQRGVFLMARELEIPIVPVTVTGMQHVMNAQSWIIRPGRTVTVYCDEPVETAGLAEDDMPALIARVREPMQKRVDDYLATCPVETA